MPIFLCIETSHQTASVALIKNGECVKETLSASQKEHASFLQPAIQDMLHESDISLSEVEAVAVSIGPGSYTGLRVGLASAKGICFAANKPLITINTLHIMADVCRNTLLYNQDILMAPMIDARRNEVFTAVYDLKLNIKMPPQAMILHDQSYQEFAHNGICFFGDGSIKWRNQCEMPNAIFAELSFSASSMITLAEEAFLRKEFASLHSSAPFYGKEFYSTAVRN
jgi:tRNA threonylcarbamoyladenosine biosynthesis protein TsaB